MDSLNELLSNSLTTLHEFASGEAVYQRGDDQYDIRVSWGSTEWEELAPNLQTLRTEARDALIQDFSELLIAIGEPLPADKIIQGETISEVMSLDDEPVFRFDGAQRHVLRIHTKLVQEASR